METILELTAAYLLLLLMALLVERAVEVLMSAWSYVEWRRGLHAFWNRRAEQLRRRYERRARWLLLSPLARATGASEAFSAEARGRAPGGSGTLTVISADLVRHGTVSAVARLVAVALGIGLCALAGLDFAALLRTELEGARGAEVWLAGGLAGWPAWAGIVVSGVLVGLGSEPLHNLITSLERQRRTRARRLKQAQAAEAGVR